MPKLPKLTSLLFLCNIFRKKEVSDEVDLYAVKHESFLQVNFNFFCINVSDKVILSLLMGIIKHSQSTQSSNFAIFLQCLKKEVRGVEYQSFYKLALSFLMKVATHVQSNQNRKLVIFLQYLKKKVSQLLLCSIVMQNIQLFCRGLVMFRCYLFSLTLSGLENLKNSIFQISKLL